MDESELPRRLSKLWEIEPIERGKAIKLINKILSKILSNPTSAKYGDLNFHKIRSKFQKCGPAFYLLYEAGFKQSMNGQRLQWTFNNENFILLKNAYNALQNKINTPEIITKPSPLKTTSESNEWLGTKYRRKIQARMKKLENEKTQKRNLIKEKIAMKKKEQKIEQKRSLEKVKIEKEKQAEAATIFMKEQFANTMNNIMNQMMKNMSPNSN
eukprot:238531_1